MVLKAWISKEEYDEMNAVLQNEYKEDGDGFMVNVKEVNGIGIGNIKKLTNAAREERKNAKNHGDKLAEYKNEDGEYIDPEEAREAIANKKKYLDAGKNQSTVEDLVKDRTKGMEENYKKEIKKRDDRIAALTGTIKKDRADVRTKTAIANKKGRMKILSPMLRSRYQVRENEKGEMYDVLVDENGEVMYSTKDPAKLMSVDEYLDILREDEETADLFEGSGMKGAGSSQSDTSTTGNERRTGGEGYPRTVKWSDTEAIGKYQKEIAAGKITVVEG